MYPMGPKVRDELSRFLFSTVSMTRCGSDIPLGAYEDLVGIQHGIHRGS